MKSQKLGMAVGPKRIRLKDDILHGIAFRIRLADERWLESVEK